MQINKILEYAAYAVGGVSLFMASLLVFALAAGVPAHDVAIIGGLFPKPPPPAQVSEKSPDGAPARPKIQAKSLEDVIASTLSRLPNQSQASPFESSELEALVGDLKRLKLQYERDLASVKAREEEVAERDAALQEQAGLIQDLMARLDQRDGELTLREQEVRRDEQVAEENEKARWKKISMAFINGDPEDLAQRLLAYGPDDGARILTNLDEDARQTLLDALDATNFKAFLDAYSSLGY